MKSSRAQGKDSPGNGPTRNYVSKRSMGGDADWEAATPGLVVKLIATATLTDGAVRFGCSTDGGAFAIGIYGDGAPYTVWVPGKADIDGELTDLIEFFEDKATVERSRAKKST